MIDKTLKKIQPILATFQFLALELSTASWAMKERTTTTSQLTILNSSKNTLKKPYQAMAFRKMSSSPATWVVWDAETLSSPLNASTRKAWTICLPSPPSTQLTGAQSASNQASLEMKSSGWLKWGPWKPNSCLKPTLLSACWSTWWSGFLTSKSWTCTYPWTWFSKTSREPANSMPLQRKNSSSESMSTMTQKPALRNFQSTKSFSELKALKVFTRWSKKNWSSYAKTALTPAKLSWSWVHSSEISAQEED